MRGTATLLAAALASPAAAQVADYRVIDGAIPEPLTDAPGDPTRGAAIFADREGARCLLCHVVDSLEAPFQGDLGPDLSGYGDYMDGGVTRLRLVDATRLNPDTIMPAYHRVEGLREVQARFRGRPVLTAQDIEDVIAYLNTLTIDREGGQQ